jgi:hypothetical protein
VVGVVLVGLVHLVNMSWTGLLSGQAKDVKWGTPIMYVVFRKAGCASPSADKAMESHKNG